MGEPTYSGDGATPFDHDASWDEVQEWLDRASDQRREWLEQELEQVEEQLERRDELYRETVDQLESRIAKYTKEIKRSYKRSLGGRGEKRQELKEELDQLYTELRKAKRKHWRDRQDLEQERRDILSKHAELDEDTTYRP